MKLVGEHWDFSLQLLNSFTLNWLHLLHFLIYITILFLNWITVDILLASRMLCYQNVAVGFVFHATVVVHKPKSSETLTRNIQIFFAIFCVFQNCFETLLFIYFTILLIILIGITIHEIDKPMVIHRVLWVQSFGRVSFKEFEKELYSWNADNRREGRVFLFLDNDFL